MNVKELRTRLAAENVDPAAYDLEDTQRDEVYCLVRGDRGWDFYYRERGLRTDLRNFVSESEACSYFLNRVLMDPTTRRR